MIKTYLGDITKLECDCIVNAANTLLAGGGGVDGAIHRAAGPKLDEACRKLNGCKVGEAKLTKGFNLRSEFIIHTVGPTYKGREQDAKDLASCYMSSLSLARKSDIHTIAFPAISTGAYGYPAEEAAKVAVEAVKGWLMINSDYRTEITFCCFDQETKDIYDRILGQEPG